MVSRRIEPGTMNLVIALPHSAHLLSLLLAHGMGPRLQGFNQKTLLQGFSLHNGHAQESKIKVDLLGLTLILGVVLL